MGKQSTLERVGKESANRIGMGLWVRDGDAAAFRVLGPFALLLLAALHGPVEAGAPVPGQALAQQVQIAGVGPGNVGAAGVQLPQQRGANDLRNAVELGALVPEQGVVVSKQEANPEGGSGDGWVLTYLAQKSRNLTEGFEKFARHNQVLLLCAYLVLGAVLGCAQNSRTWAEFWGALAEIYRTPRDFVLGFPELCRWCWEEVAERLRKN